MVSTSYSPEIQIRFDSEFFRQVQHVTVSVHGFDYPGEVIVAPQWDPQFGTALSGISMFRLVLLTAYSAEINSSSLASGVGVAVPGINAPYARESTEVSYLSHTDRIDQQLTTLRETRSEYSAGVQQFDSVLLSAISKSESQLNEAMAQRHLEGWRTGFILTSDNESTTANAARMFVTNEPAAWVEYAISKFSPHRITGTAEIFLHASNQINDGKVDRALPGLVAASGIFHGDPTPLDHLNELLERSVESVSAEEIRTLLLREFSFPPLVANVWLAAWICTQELEVRLDSSVNGSKVVSRHTLPRLPEQFSLIGDAKAVTRSPSASWDGSLEWLRVIWPNAVGSNFGGGRPSDFSEFELQVESHRNRLSVCSSSMFGLEFAAGATERPLTRIHGPLQKVLDHDKWAEFIDAAIQEFKTVDAFRKAMEQIEFQWLAVEFAAETQMALEYIAQCEFGREDHAIALEARFLRDQMDLSTLVQNQEIWKSLSERFTHWKLDYSRAYRQFHSEYQREAVATRTRLTAVRQKVVALYHLNRIDVIADPSLSQFDDRLPQINSELNICGESFVDTLDAVPLCSECGVRLGSPVPSHHVDLIEQEVESLFEKYVSRLREALANLVLESIEPDKLKTLIRLNQSGDLSGLVQSLDNKTVGFINELFRGRTTS